MADSSSPPPASIRPYERRDLEAVRYFIGSDVQECLPAANRALFTTPGGVIAWTALTLFVMAITGWWPRLGSAESQGIFGALLTTLICLAPMAMAVLLILGVAELQHRTLFEEAVTKRLGEDDLRDIEAHYRADPHSGFYVLDYGDKVIGLVALDAASTSSATGDKAKATGKKEGVELRKRKGAATTRHDNTEPTARIRHLGTSLSYREAGIELDLLEHALKRAFAPSSPIQRVEIVVRPALQKARLQMLTQKGFKETGKVTEGDVVKPAEGTGVLSKLSRSLGTFWPLDLGARVYTVERR